MFRRMDADGNGKLTKSELPPQMRQRWAMMDTNGDGVGSNDLAAGGDLVLGDGVTGAVASGGEASRQARAQPTGPTELQSLGIPAEVVSIPPNKILRPDLQIDNVDVATRWRTFWYLQEDEDL